jgi:hypothetical protein
MAAKSQRNGVNQNSSGVIGGGMAKIMAMAASMAWRHQRNQRKSMAK